MTITAEQAAVQGAQIADISATDAVRYHDKGGLDMRTQAEWLRLWVDGNYAGMRQLCPRFDEWKRGDSSGLVTATGSGS